MGNCHEMWQLCWARKCCSNYCMSHLSEATGSFKKRCTASNLFPRFSEAIFLLIICNWAPMVILNGCWNICVIISIVTSGGHRTAYTMQQTGFMAQKLSTFIFISWGLTTSQNVYVCLSISSKAINAIISNFLPIYQTPNRHFRQIFLLNKIGGVSGN